MSSRQTKKGPAAHEKIVNDLERALDSAYEAFGDDQEAFQKATEEIVRFSKQLKGTSVPPAARPDVVRRLKAKGMERKKHGYPMCFWELETAIKLLASP